MPIKSKEEAKALLQKALSFSKADECEVNLNGGDGGNIRYARNAVSTSGGISQQILIIQSTFGKKIGTTTVNEFNDASIEKAVRLSEELAMLAPENPEYVKNLGPQQYLESATYNATTAAITPKYRADAVAESLQISKDNNLTVAGFLEDRAGYSAIMNSAGLFAYNKATNVAFNVTMRTNDGKGSGYASKGYNDVAELNVTVATKIAAQKAMSSAAAKAIEPGKYTVILEPAAGIVLLENMYNGMDARSADEGRSFLSKPGGKTRLGEKLVDERVNIFSDPLYPGFPSGTWSNDGRPQQKMNWIENGVVKNLYYSRYWAEKKGVPSVPPPSGIIMQGGNATLEELIKSTEKGILVTRLWYIRSVDPQTLLVTGLTRDGTFYIEDGKIKFPVKNLRFNESPIIMLNNLEALGKTERTVSGESDREAMIPPMKIRDFTFTSLSDAV